MSVDACTAVYLDGVCG